MLVQVRFAVAGGVVALTLVLAALEAVVGLTVGAWGVGLGCGLLVSAAVGRGAGRRLTPADLVTLARALLGCSVAALATEAWAGHAVTTSLVTVGSVCLVLDAVDGQVARRTGLPTGFGARFDGEADAFLLLVLSVHVAASYGAWVLLIGAARYAFWAAGLVRPWLRAGLPRRDWRKVVTAVQGIVLVVAASGLLPASATVTALGVALALLAESFGRDVLWLVGRRPDRRRGASAASMAGRLPAP